MIVKLQYFIFCINIFMVAAMPAQAEVEFSYDKNTFINYSSCLGIYPESSLEIGEKVWIFSKDLYPTPGKVAHVIPAAEAEKKFDALGFTKVYMDKHLWEEIRCVQVFRGDMPVALARLEPQPIDFSGFGFAIRGLPAGALIADGKGESVPMELNANPYVSLVRGHVTAACYSPESLVRVKKFPVLKGRAIIQLDIGEIKKLSPEKKKQLMEREKQVIESIYKKEAWSQLMQKKQRDLERPNFVESVEICRFFLEGKRVLKSEKISRSTGTDERVDTTPDLNTNNWADTTTSAIGFVSLNEGRDWDVLLVDVGFEGINYSIERLNGSSIHYKRSLYTYH